MTELRKVAPPVAIIFARPRALDFRPPGSGGPKPLRFEQRLSLFAICRATGGVPAPAQARRGGGAAPAPQAAEVAEVANGGVIQR
eukprot:5449161-Pyramimonas_sp.AAC.1